MGIPKKPESSSWASKLVNPRSRAAFSSIMTGIRGDVSKVTRMRIRDIPPKQLFKWTAFFFIASQSFFMWVGGPSTLYHQNK